MSFFNNVTRTKITGLTAGSWSTVNIASFVSIPAGAKSVFLCFDTYQFVSVTHGARKKGSSDTFINASLTRLINYKLVELVGGEVELYTSNTTYGEWYIESFDSHFTHVTPIEKGGTTTGGTYTITYSELPDEAAGGTVLMELSKGPRIGLPGAVPVVSYNPIPRAHVMLPIDSLKRLQYISSGGTILDSDLRVVAWAKAGAVVHASSSPSRALASANTWLDLPDSTTQGVMTMYRLYSASDNTFYGMRAKGSSANEVETNLYHRYTYARNGDGGVTQANVASTSTLFYYFGVIVGSLAPATITDIDQLIAGQTSTVTLSSTTFIPTTFNISDGAVTKTVSATFVSAGEYSFVAPLWVDGQTAIKFGTVSVTASDGTESTPVFNKVITPWGGNTSQDLDSVSEYNYGAIAGFSPALKIGTQSVYNSLECRVYSNGICDDNGTGFIGNTTIWDRDPDDKIARVGLISIEGGVPAPSDSGLTASGLTHRGFSVSGLTHRGL